MKWYRAIVNDKIIAYNIKMANNFFQRLIGLLNKKIIYSDEGLLLNKCRQIHTIGMKFSIDAIFLSDGNEVVYIENNLQPGRISKYVKDACHVLELKAGTASRYNVRPNEVVSFITL